MAKRTKKPAIQPETRQDWFERFTRFGESISQIAKKDEVDIRTVRKHIELARREVELHRAEATTLLNAMQDHHKDLCDFARKLDNQLTSERNALLQLREDPFWPALRQHLPRSIIWKNLDRWEQLREQRTETNKKNEKLLEAQIDKKLRDVSDSYTTGLDKRLFGALILHIKDTALAEPDALKKFDMSKIPESDDPKIAEMVHDILSEVAQWPEYTEMINLSRELEKTRKSLHEELLTIILRRVVPGKCRYCPV